MVDEDVYTKDGTVDINKNPANRKKTGNWKACRFILGRFYNYFVIFLNEFNSNCVSFFVITDYPEML